MLIECVYRDVDRKKRVFIFRGKIGENEGFETWSGLPAKCPIYTTDDAIDITWNNPNRSNDFFEFVSFNDYTRGYFTIEGGRNSSNPGARIIEKDNDYIYIFSWGNLDGV
jgi:hypothetical protein